MSHTFRSEMMRGFTLIEMLVSLLIFSIVVIAIYFFFDQGQWLYLHSEKRVNAQENARLVIEQMERDFRMIGAGVPLGTNVTTGTSWTPFIFSASDISISFTGDIDNGTIGLLHDGGTFANDHVYIGPPVTGTYYKSFDADNNDVLDTNIPIVLDSDRKSWQDLVAASLFSQGLITTTDMVNPAIFKADRSAVHTLEHVYYRMVGNIAAGACTDPYPFCRIERQVAIVNDPTSVTPSPSEWKTVATYVTYLSLTYWTAADVQINPATDPLDNIDKVKILLKCADREQSVGKYQTTILKSEILIRNRAL